MWIEATSNQAVPDLNVIRNDQPTRPKRRKGRVVIAARSVTEPLVIHVPHIEISELYLNIFTWRKEQEQIVTTIEILSASNKTPGEKGQQLYQRKQQEILAGNTHLVEIDLLRCGTHSTSVPLERLKALAPNYDYHVCIKHFDKAEDFFVYPINLPDRLPTIAIPLLPGDGLVLLDLQEAFDRTYDAGPYEERARSTDPVPAPTLSEEKTAWVQQTLRAKRLLRASRP